MTKFDHGISRLQMTRFQLVIFSCVNSTMEKIRNLTMNLYILLNSDTADGSKEPHYNTADGFRVPLKGSLNPYAILEFSKM